MLKTVSSVSIVCVLLGIGNIQAQQSTLPASPDTILFQNVELEGAPAGTALMGLARLYGINLTVEENLDIPITLHLDSITAEDLFRHLASAYPLVIERRGDIRHIRRRQESDREQKLDISWQMGRLELEARDVRIDSLGSALARRRIMTLLPGDMGQRKLSGFISTSQPEAGIRALLGSHDLEMVRQGPGIFLVRERKARESEQEFELYADGGFVTFSLRKAPLEQVLRQLARVLEWNVFFYGQVEGEVTASAENIPAMRALELLLVGTGLGIRLEEQSLLVGNADLVEFGEVRLIQLKHLKVEGLIDRLPETIKEKATLEMIAEQNGVLASGSPSALNAVEAFIQSIDHPLPQILFETLVVDFYDEVGSELGLDIGVGAPRDTTYAQTFFPEVDVETRGTYITGKLSIQDHLPIVSHLPDDFYIRLRALEQEGRVRIRSRPQLATLNGSPATLTVGTTQYFLIRSETTFAQQTVQTRISEQFETIEANMLLQITPWVTTTGEIITQIRPEFNTPQGTLNAEVPPTINHRIVDTTVRLRDGETIILGGLVQETENEQERRFPLLWRIPLLGKLFVSKVQSTTTSELMIYLTPHVYYGDEGAVIPPDGDM